MEVILRDDVPKLGIIGDVVNVKAGYARNYLLPRGLAVVADRRNLKQLEHQKALIDLRKERRRSEVEKIAAIVEGVVVETEVRAGKEGKLFGSVTNADVCRLLAEKGIEIDRHDIELHPPIKDLGEHAVSVHVGQGIRRDIKVVVSALGQESDDEVEPEEGTDRVENVDEGEGDAKD
ncbi:MAG: 50S ribosomal protein L9 [Candidatus Binatia bacterium]